MNPLPMNDDDESFLIICRMLNRLSYALDLCHSAGLLAAIQSASVSRHLICMFKLSRTGLTNDTPTKTYVFGLQNIGCPLPFDPSFWSTVLAL